MRIKKITQNTRDFNITDAIVDGGTDLNEVTFNQMQDNIEEDINRVDGYGKITAKITESQECVNGATTLLLLKSAINIGNDFTLKNNSTILCNKKGYIEVSANFAFENLVVNGNLQPRIYKNYNIAYSKPVRPQATNTQSFSISPIILEVNAGDDISIKVGNWSGAPVMAFTGPETTCLLTAKYLKYTD